MDFYFSWVACTHELQFWVAQVGLDVKFHHWIPS